jgi:voltage-gated potassium channel Kch
MASALFVVLGVSALMEAVGLSAALGAFLAGVFLADSEYRHELEANLEPFKSLFMGLFFIAVGMAVRIDLIWREPATVFLLAFAYLAVKMALIYLVGRSSRLTKASAGFMAVSIAQGGEFAFVIFGLAAQLHLAAPDTLALLVAVISLSMVLSPLIGLGNERFLRRRRNAITPQYDQIEGETARVIIAGFGRFGQIFGRILRAQDIAFVAIDQDPDQVELIRRFGYKVYYGDVSRFEILQAAGAGKASYLILALDDVDTANRTVHLAQEHFPHLTIFARARNRGHAFDLMEMGVTAIKRELFDSSVSFVGDLLVKMGFPPAKAALIIDKFKRHDEIMLREQFKVRGDDKVFVSVSRQGAEQLANVLREEGTQSYIDGV